MIIVLQNTGVGFSLDKSVNIMERGHGASRWSAIIMNVQRQSKPQIDIVDRGLLSLLLVVGLGALTFSLTENGLSRGFSVAMLIVTVLVGIKFYSDRKN